MKNLITIIIVLLISTNLFSQINMKIHKNDGSVFSIPISEIDSIYYEEDQGSTTVTDYDGNVYETVTIGNQIWMKENLKVTHYPDGTPIPVITSDTTWANLEDNNTDDAYCYYNNDANGEASTFGALYTWAAAMGDNAVSSNSYPSGVQGVCPDGWHLPSSSEWTELTNSILGGNNVAGGKMKAMILWESPNTGATNSSGFTGLPSGRRYSNYGSFGGMYGYCFWWSTTEYNEYNAYYTSLYSNTEVVMNDKFHKSDGASVRCIKD